MNSWLKLTGNKSDEKTTRENSNNKTEVEMFLILQVEYSIGYLKIVEVNENLQTQCQFYFSKNRLKRNYAKLPSLYSQNYDFSPIKN